MTTISASTTLGIDLNPAFYTSPVVIGAGVTVSNTGYPDAVYRHSGATTFFVIDNNGAITGSSIGVYLAPGGSVTNASSAGITGAKYAVKISGGAGTVVNDGGIYGSGERLPTDGTGVYLLSGGSVTNASSASIGGAKGGVEISGGAGTVVNDGGIFSRVGGGLALPSGGSVTNASHGYIRGAAGVAVSRGTVVNDGSILGGILLGGILSGSSGVYMGSGGSVTNSPSASITGARVGVDLSGGTTLTNAGSISGGIYGVSVHGGGTLTNAGSIIGSGGTAVAFGGTGSNLLVLDPGFDFSGLVSGGTSSSNSIELASGSSTGTVAGLGSEFVRFGSIAFDPGAQWFAAGVQSGLAGPISGFAVGDTIELTGDTAIGSSFVTGVLTLDLAGGGSATLDLPGTFASASDFEVTNVATGADVTLAPAPCFCAGTGVLTLSGEMAVEALAQGDVVVTATGRLRRVRWIGHRCIEPARLPKPRDVLPVRIKAHAFGPGVPHRDLSVSPDHAVFINGVLIPIRYLINGCTVVQERVDEVTYYHVELPAHDVILAEGLPCESYLDTGNRAAFEDGSTAAVAVASA